MFCTVLVLAIACQKRNTLVKKSDQNTNAQLLFAKSKNKSISTIARLKYLDSALKSIPGESFDSLALAILYNKSYCHYQLGQKDSSHYHDKGLLKKALQVDNHFYAARSSKDIAIYYDNRQAYDSAFFYHNLSKNYFISLKDSAQIGRRLIRLGIIQQNHNDHFGAKETLTEAFQYFKMAKDDKYIAAVYNGLGTNNRKLLNRVDAINYYQKAIKTSNSKNDIKAYQNNLAVTYTDNGDYHKSIGILKKLLADSLLNRNSIRYARILHNYTYASWKIGASNIEEPFNTALQIRIEKNDGRGQIASYTDMAEYYMAYAPNRSRAYLDKVIALSKRLKIPKAETDALKLLMKISPKNNGFKSRYIFLKDSLYDEELRVKTQFAKMKYDDNLKQEVITALETETQLQTAELFKQRTQKIMYLSFSSLFLFIGIVLFFFIKQKHRREKLNEIYATEKRISQKIHDELANDIYGVMTSMQHSKDLEKENMLDTLENIYNRTRDISHETGDIKTKDYHLELKKLLSQYQTLETTITVKGLDEALWENIQDYKKIATYRVLNELMVNMKKHSKASLVALSFERQKKFLKISYADNGIGMKNIEKKGIGLQNAENRIYTIDGTFIFDSEPEKGIKISFLFPIDTI
ncbi:MAG: hypothetical protein COA50_16045 [Flavobacteriaceae bacterium]|nr:MAG: hypothetical protein COA50_16045 [Flavobacteriaceae bacterium]